MERSHQHLSVLMDEVLEGLNIRPEGIYFDGTFGRGGHAGAILQRLGPQGRLLAMDKDPDAIKFATERFANDDRFVIRQGSFAMMAEMVDEAGLTGQIDGVLLDLGVSSPQLDNAGRGFSFMKDGPLDMRMDTSQGQSAADWLATADEQLISEILRDYGEERFHRRIARAIVEQRELEALQTTLQLAALIEKAVPKREKGKHPATRSFQAIRIYINRELDDLREGLEQAVAVLREGGRLVVISFHSLEDRLVKRFFRQKTQGERLPLDLPVQHEKTGAELKLVGKARRAGTAEIELNIRARSASLRVAEKIAG
jgi:16S rRNA (cytosine1402-N4)-methyltransferase